LDTRTLTDLPAASFHPVAPLVAPGVAATQIISSVLLTNVTVRGAAVDPAWADRAATRPAAPASGISSVSNETATTSQIELVLRMDADHTRAAAPNMVIRSNVRRRKR
jgi:hypothetical protein